MVLACHGIGNILRRFGVIAAILLLSAACDVAPPQQSPPPSPVPDDAAPVPADPVDGDAGADDGVGDDGDDADDDEPRPAADVTLQPGADVAAQIDRAAAGATIRFTAGVYRGLQIEPRDGMTFIADDGAVLRGSTALSGFTREGGRWVVSGVQRPTDKPVQGEEWGFCDDGRDACVQPQDLYLDGKPLRRVTSVANVTSGTWYFDTAGGRVHLGDDPSGRRVELGTSRYAFHGSADDVTIDGFTIEHYATPGRQGAINPRVGRAGAAGLDWTVTDNVLRFNHGWGVKMETGMRIAGNVIRGNGQGGIGGVADRAVIEGHDVVDNCVAGFRCFGWEGGGMKLHGDDLTVRDNTVRSNRGHGIHTDIGCDRAVIDGNVVLDNQGAGIHHEISGSATITGNSVQRNGFRPTGVSEPGILVINSSEVEISGNEISGNARQIVLRQGDRTSAGILRAIAVSGNAIDLAGAGDVVVAKTQGVSAPGWGEDIAFSDNTYTVAAAAGTSRPFKWRDATMTIEQWRRQARQDADSEFVTGS